MTKAVTDPPPSLLIRDGVRGPRRPQEVLRAGCVTQRDRVEQRAASVLVLEVWVRAAQRDQCLEAFPVAPAGGAVQGGEAVLVHGGDGGAGVHQAQ